MEEAAMSISVIQVAMSMEVASQAFQRGNKKRALEVLNNVKQYVKEAEELVSGMK